MTEFLKGCVSLIKLTLRQDRWRYSSQCLLAHRVGNKRLQCLSLNSDWFIGLTGFGKLKALILNHVETVWTDDPTHC